MTKPRLHLEMLAAAASLPSLMRILAASLCLFAFTGAHALAASAFTALQLLPPEQARSVAVIAGREGTPEPERWHFLVHDPKAENGLREIVVTGAKKTADRSISQFAESLTAGDVISPEALKVDSSQVAQMARDFGVANKASVAAMHFDLRKSGPEAKPLWTITCLDANGSELGKILVSATTGTVIMHPGFTVVPQIDPLLAAARGTPTPVASDDLRPSSSSDRSVKKSAPKKRPTTPTATPNSNFLKRLFGPRQ